MQRDTIQFVHNVAFEAVDALERFLSPIDVPVSGLLPVEVERALFLRMNFAKWRASTDPSVAEAMRAQAQADRSILVERNLPLVKSLVVKMTRRTPQLHDDAFAEGSLRLLQAVDTYDAGRGLKFSTFAFGGIRWGVLAIFNAENRVRDKAMGKPLPGIDDVVKLLHDRHSFEDEIERISARVEAAELLAVVPAADREAVAALYGVDGRPEPITARDAYETFGVSKQRVFQRKNRAFKRMREASERVKVRTA